MIHGRETSQDWQLAGGERSKAELSVAPETLQDWRRGVASGEGDGFSLHEEEDGDAMDLSGGRTKRRW
ncbi:hypothetical protein NQZ68_005863 [Dissostichus eleginoides]|nr:hypothetical protein NQZ68_005863 [Dissostichus eleginoides]